ncbi:hypothetical protein [Lacinutrix sp. MEBiC02404]
MSKKNYSKLSIIIFTLLIFNCSSSHDKDNESVLTISNKARIAGVWYEFGQCQDQNSFMFNEDLSYQLLNSGNIDCSNNETSTYKYTGTYNIVDNELFFYQLTDGIIIQGNGVSVQEFELFASRKQTIEVLDDSFLQIKTTIVTDSGVATFSDVYER